MSAVRCTLLATVILRGMFMVTAECITGSSVTKDTVITLSGGDAYKPGWNFIDPLLQFLLISAFSGFITFVLNLTELWHIHNIKRDQGPHNSHNNKII